jgi:hypothetical protein
MAQAHRIRDGQSHRRQHGGGFFLDGTVDASLNELIGGHDCSFNFR